MFETNDQEKEVASLIIESLNLEDTELDDIDPDAALFKDGLGLDSIDALELSMAISQKYGFKIKSDAKDNAGIFASLRALAKHVETNRV
ncbi:MAG: phosphopantetheine-binding protein [Acidiferrobacterales bacterium]